MPSIPSSLRNGGNKATQQAQPTQPKDIFSFGSAHLNFYCFLSVAQKHGVEFMPISWEPGRDLLGHGVSGHVNQSIIDIQTSLAFKRPAGFSRDEKSRQKLFMAWLLEISILRFPEIQRHPNIIEVEGISWEIVESGSTVLPVLVYRKSQLGTLRTFIEANAGSLSLNQKLNLCLDLASALSTLHSCNVVHGDVKPGNVVVFSKSPDSHEVVAKMIDFGNSCYGMEDEDVVKVTGTPLWSAPENNGGEVTILSAKKMDVYSFALVCCWILFFHTASLDDKIEVETRELSITENPKKKMYQFIERVKDAERPDGPISEAISQTPFLGEQKSILLQKLLTEALCKNPSSRLYNWSEFILVLSKFQGLDPPILPTIDRPQLRITLEPCEFHVLDSMANFDMADFRVRRFVTEALEQTMNHSPCVKCSANAAFEKALCQRIGFGEPRNEILSDASLLKSGRLPEDLDSEIARFRNVGHEGLGSRIRQLVRGYSLDLPYTYQLHGCLGLAESECEREIEHRQLVVPANHPSLLRLRYVLGHIYEALNRWKRAENVYMELWEARKGIFGLYATTTLICEAKVGSCLVNQGELARGEQMLRDALYKLQISQGEDNTSAIAAMGHLGSTLMEQGRFEEANEIFTRQMEISTKVRGKNQVDTISILPNLALNKFSAGNWEESEKLTLQAIEMQKGVLGLEDRQALNGMHNLCSVYIEQGRYDDAQRIHEQEMRIYKKSGNTEGLGPLLSLANLGLILSGQGKLDEAVKILHRTANAMERLMGERYPDTLSTWSNLASAYRQQNQLDEARKIQERVVSLMEAGPELRHAYAPGFIAGLANIYLASGIWDKAEEAFLRAVKLADVNFGSKHPWTLFTRASLATLYKGQYRLDEAKDIEEDVVESLKKELGRSHQKILTAMRNLSITYRLLGKLDEAQQLQNEIDLLRPKSSDQSELLEDKLNLSNILFSQQAYEQARKLQEEVCTTLEIQKGPQDPETLNSRFHLSQTYRALGLLQESERIHKDDIPRHISLYSEEHDLTLKSRSELASVLIRQDRWEEAEQQYRETLRTYTKMGLQNYRSALKARLGIAYAKSGQGQYEEAMMILKEFGKERKEGKFQVDEELAQDVEEVCLVVAMAQAGPQLLSAIEKAKKEISDLSNHVTKGLDDQS